MDLLKEITNNQLTNLFINGNFGLEKEGLRATGLAELALTEHPELLGDREVHPFIKTDYGEAMPEIITPPLSPYSNAHNFLQSLSTVLVSCLPENEYMWPFSVPCNLPDEDLIRTSKTSNPDLIAYRLYTTSKYGKKRQLVNGIHINYSFNQEFIEILFANQDEFESITALRDELYLKLASNFLRYQWLLVYLFGATPIAEADFFDGPFFKGKKLPTKSMRSLRNSQFGFTNDPKVIVRYDSIENYANDLREAVATGQLQKEREYYGSVRLRGKIKDTKSLLEDGIMYLEFRSFDNDPYEISGLSKDTLQFIHLFILMMLTLPEKVVAEETEIGNTMTKEVAEEETFVHTAYAEEGEWLLEQMDQLVEQLELEESYNELVQQAREQLKHPEQTIAGRIVSEITEDTSLLEFGAKLGQYNKDETIYYDGLPGFDHLDKEQERHLFSIIQLGLDVPVDYLQAEHLE